MSYQHRSLLGSDPLFTNVVLLHRTLSQIKKVALGFYIPAVCVVWVLFGGFYYSKKPHHFLLTNFKCMCVQMFLASFFDGSSIELQHYIVSMWAPGFSTQCEKYNGNK